MSPKIQITALLLMFLAFFACGKYTKKENKQSLNCDSLESLYAEKPEMDIYLNNFSASHKPETAFTMFGDSAAKAMGYTLETWQNGAKKDTFFMIGEGAKVELCLIPSALLIKNCHENYHYGVESAEIWVKYGNKPFENTHKMNLADKILENNRLEFPLPEPYTPVSLKKAKTQNVRVFFKIIAKNIFYLSPKGEKRMLKPQIAWGAEII